MQWASGVRVRPRPALTSHGNGEGAVSERNDPWGLLAVDLGKIGLEPPLVSVVTFLFSLNLLANLAAWGRHLLASTANLVRAKDTRSEIGLKVENDVVHHAVVVRVPEVLAWARLSWHVPVLGVSSEVGLAGHADGRSVGDVVRLVGHTTVVAVGLVVSDCDHVWLGRGERGEFVVELLVEELVVLNNGRSVGQDVRSAVVAGDTGLEEVVGVSKVSNMDDVLKCVEVLRQRLDGVGLVRGKVGDSLGSPVTKAVGAHQTHVTNNGDRLGSD